MASSFVWSSIITELALPGAWGTFDPRGLDEEQNQTAVEALFQFLADFLQDRDAERDGLRIIFHDYSLRFAE
ncbi:hypothetical protein [Streptomyces plumbiresistens]|uniref:Uncharacterized protein n=1 Tax=Streptomyces plumbiresistens TaxID=511811 RepID=A0ABP7Q0R8_9ACTN